ncbi:hypothetical protein SAMN06297229_0956 [Pseudidiomarina planktonica]|uniref:Flp pilus-assembly TadE/G-like n=1 Tax=Pseudidiomarina planktonica TaxID=1323738 RepID=A0A1Y6EP40_9GAMM|nr:hypothetical protein [Pseudidiomarina planktonica]RUO65618.1 hypothetical protein CWI77_03975 [Pseudidiomarina planktonica]SMQ64069.1 hypothetical protein SAMN06297229_0956 [Pseudidiomarina planktonica]
MIVSHKHIQGQISLLFGTTLAALLVVTLLLASSMRQISQQWYLQNVADAAASSGALVMARELNFIALTNRALIANQIALAQLVGLVSWMAMLEDGSKRLAMISRVVPYLNTFTHQLQNFIRSARPIIEGLIKLAIISQRVVVQAISASQRAAHVAFTTLIVQTIEEVTFKHDPNLSWEARHTNGVVPAPWLWWRKIHHPSTAEPGQLTLSELALASRDPFSLQRSYTWLDLGILKMKKGGGTELHVEPGGRWSWQALDTTSLHQRLLFWSSEAQWARGARYLSHNRRYLNNSDHYGSSTKYNRAGTRSAKRLARSLQQPMPAFTFTSFKGAAEVPQILVRIKTPSDENEQSQQVFSKAGVTFSRPLQVFSRADNSYEGPNLFNALWYSELKPLTSADKLVLTVWGRS